MEALLEELVEHKDVRQLARFQPSDIASLLCLRRNFIANARQNFIERGKFVVTPHQGTSVHSGGKQPAICFSFGRGIPRMWLKDRLKGSAATINKYVEMNPFIRYRCSLPGSMGLGDHALTGREFLMLSELLDIGPIRPKINFQNAARVLHATDDQLRGYLVDIIRGTEANRDLSDDGLHGQQLFKLPPMNRGMLFEVMHYFYSSLPDGFPREEPKPELYIVQESRIEEQPPRKLGKLRRKHFPASQEYLLALQKLEGDVPDDMPYIAQAMYKNRQRGGVYESVGSQSAQPGASTKLKAGDQDLATQLQAEMESMTGAELAKITAWQKTSGEIFACLPEQLTGEDAHAAVSSLKYAVDLGFTIEKMKKALRDIGDFSFPARYLGHRTRSKKTFIAAYKKVVSTFYPLKTEDVAHLVLYRAAKARLSVTEDDFAEFLTEARPVEFMGELYFQPKQVKTLLNHHLQDLDTGEYLHFNQALRLIREYEQEHGVTGWPYASRELVDKLPKYQLKEDGEKGAGHFVKREELEQGVLAMLKHVYKVPEFQDDVTITPFDAQYRTRELVEEETETDNEPAVIVEPGEMSDIITFFGE